MEIQSLIALPFFDFFLIDSLTWSVRRDFLFDFRNFAIGRKAKKKTFATLFSFFMDMLNPHLARIRVHLQCSLRQCITQTNARHFCTYYRENLHHNKTRIKNFITKSINVYIEIYSRFKRHVLECFLSVPIFKGSL